jgi:hypothetical protein
MKHLYNDFELNFDKVTREVIAATVKIIQFDDPQYLSEDLYCVTWNMLGNYILWNDGGETFYFTKKYLKINGGDYYNPHEIQRGFNFLKQHQS